jgi:cysteine desulfurase
MYVNNEIGTVQPIREIGKMIEKTNEDRKKNDLGRIYFHTDAVQAAEFLDLDVKRLFVDLLTMTAHKIHGPKGVGLLFVKKGTPLTPQIVGGEHEFRLRAGTENVAGIVGMAEAIRQVESRKSKVEDIKKLRDRLENSILKNIPETYLNGDKEKRAPHISNISFKNAEGEAIILNLDFLGIAVSSGSACTARSLEPSHVLSAIDIPHELSHGAIRFSLSRETTDVEIDKVLEVLPRVINKLREMSPFK